MHSLAPITRFYISQLRFIPEWAVLCMPHTYHLHGNQRPGPPLGWWRALSPVKLASALATPCFHTMLRSPKTKACKRDTGSLKSAAIQHHLVSRSYSQNHCVVRFTCEHGFHLLRQQLAILPWFAQCLERGSFPIDVALSKPEKAQVPLIARAQEKLAA